MILLWLSIEPHTRSNQEKLGLALPQLMCDDSSLAVRSGAGEIVMLGAPNEDRLEAVVRDLVQRFGVEAAVRALEVAYKETVTRSADGESKYIVRSGGRGRYAHVKVRVEPGEPGSGCVFENAIAGGAIPERMTPSKRASMR
jgi:elongation factor G